MTVPEYQALMLPLLKIASNGIEHSLSEVIETLAGKFHRNCSGGVKES